MLDSLMELKSPGESARLVLFIIKFIAGLGALTNGPVMKKRNVLKLCYIAFSWITSTAGLVPKIKSNCK